MLALLTDAHISLSVAQQVQAKRPDCSIASLRYWRGGELLRADDDVILMAALTEGLTLVTYDQSTILPLITQWMTDGQEHGGVLFIDDRTIAQKDVGGQVLALLDIWDATRDQDWRNVVTYLRPVRRQRS